MRKKIIMGLVITLLTTTIVGCGNNSDANNSNENNVNTIDKNVLTIAMPQSAEPEFGFDPSFGWGAAEHAHEPLIQSTLLKTGTNLAIDYDIATNYEISNDGLTWTVDIRDDIEFTDGKPLNSEDVAFTYNTVKENSSINDLTMMKSCDVVDEDTVIINMEKPFSSFAYTMTTIGIVPKHLYSNSYGQNPIGSGRYILESWKKGEQAIFVANESYYGDIPKINKVVFLFMTEDAALAAAKSGKVDMAYTSATFGNQKISGMHLESYKSVDNRGLSLPVVKSGKKTEEGYDIGNDVTADIAIRKALAYGLDRETLANAVLYGYGTAAYSVCDNLPWYNEDSKIEYNFEKATEFLEDAGWKIGENGIREKDGLKAEFSLLYPSYDSARQSIAMETSNLAKKLGIQINPEGLSWDEIDKKVYSTPVLYGWGANNPMELYNLYYSGVPYNKASYSNETVDSYMDKALEATDIKDAYEYWQKSQWDGTTGLSQNGDCPWVWLLNLDHLYFVKDGLNVYEQKIHPHGNGWSVVNNVDQWYWE